MKIIDKTVRETVTFGSLADGSFFKDEVGAVCMKFSRIVYENNADEFCENYNAYDFTNNEFTCFSYAERVEKVQAELILNPTIT